MYNYMRALQRHFDSDPSESKQMEQKIDLTRKELGSQLNRHERKLLLRLIDQEDALRNKTALNSFAAGYRTACEIARELSMAAPYSFIRDEERQAVAALEQEGKE